MMLLKGYDLWSVIEETAPEDKALLDEWKKKDQFALSSIALAIKPTEQEHIYECKTAKEAWKALKEVYEGRGTHRVLSLLKFLF